MSSVKTALSNGAVLGSVQNVCPEGTKMFILHIGYLAADAGWFLRGGNGSTLSNPDGPKQRERRDLVMYSVLIDHPHEGLILWETGCGKDYPEVWGAPLNDIFARVKYEPSQELDAAIAKAGYNIKDVKHVIIGHLHLDHAGGLEHFRKRDVDVWCHDEELRHAFWAIATGADKGVYLEHYMKFDIKWRTFTEQTLEWAQGITLHHLPGHTPGLIGLQVNLPNDGTFIFTSDHFHVLENYTTGVPQGWLARDHNAWFEATARVQRLEKRTKGRVIPGHDTPTLDKLWQTKTCWT